MDFNFNKKLNSGALAGASFSVMMVVFIIITFFLSLVVSIFTTEGLIYDCICSLSPIISLALVTFLYGRYNKVNIFKSSLGKKINPLYILLGLVLAGGMFLGLGFANDLIGKGILFLGLKIPESRTVNTLSEFLAYTVFLAILPAVMEEYFFRGVMLNAFNFDAEYTLKKAVCCSLLTALSFALYHGSIVQFVYQFVFGFFMCLLTIKSKSIIPSIIAHFANNFIILSFMYFKVSVDLYSPLLIAIGGVLLIGFSLVIFLYKGKGGSNQTAIEQSQEIGVAKNAFLYGSIGFAICIALIVGGLFI